MEPKNRDRLPNLRGRFFCRMPMSTQMPMSPNTASASTTQSNRKKWPMRGSAKSGSKICPWAVTRVRNKMMNPIIVTQCATATRGSLAMRVWPRNSRISVIVRAPGSSERFVG